MWPAGSSIAIRTSCPRAASAPTTESKFFRKEARWTEKRTRTRSPYHRPQDYPACCRMRILFQFSTPSYQRWYGSTIRLLADRGHTVLLSYDHPDKRRGASSGLVEEHERIEVVPALPLASRRFESRIEQLRV